MGMCEFSAQVHIMLGAQEKLRRGWESGGREIIQILHIVVQTSVETELCGNLLSKSGQSDSSNSKSLGHPGLQRSA